MPGEEVAKPFPLRTDSYQTAKSVTAVVYLKGVTRGVANWQYDPEPRTLAVSVTVDGDEYTRVWAWRDEVIPESIKVDEGKIKIEITIQKKKAGIWTKTEVDEAELGPLYQKWQGVRFPEEEEKTEGPDKFLKKIYADSDDDIKRAMIKSMQESGGTVLSTNWKDVGSRHVDPYKDKEERERDE